MSRENSQIKLSCLITNYNQIEYLLIILSKAVKMNLSNPQWTKLMNI